MVYNIMNKFTLIPLISALSCSPLIHAGGMGDQSCGNTGNCSAGFISLEGGYTVNTIGNYNFTLLGVGGGAFESIKTSQHYTGRLAAGMLNMMDDQVGMTGELGWGYYGRTTLNPPNLIFGNLTIQNTLTGFDALVGIAYVQPYFSLSFKAGGLIQNMVTNTTSSTDFAALLGFPATFATSTKVNQTAVLPEIKLGASYNFDSNWGLTAAFISAFGSSPKTTATFDPVSGDAVLTTNNQNPTINALLLGVQYTA
jgi:hypothetical protein